MNLKQFLDLSLSLNLCTKEDNGEEEFTYTFICNSQSVDLPFEQMHLLQQLFDEHWKLTVRTDDESNLRVDYIWEKNPSK